MRRRFADAQTPVFSEAATSGARSVWLHAKPAWLPVFLATAGVLIPSAPIIAQDLKPATEDRVKRATVMVFNFLSKSKKNDTAIGSGSGFFINNTGMAITNNHVVDPTHLKPEDYKFNYNYRNGRVTVQVVVDSGTEDEKTYDANVLYQNDSADQAILQVLDEEGEKLETPDYLHLLPESRLKNRMKVFAMGFPGGDRQAKVKDKHPEVTITTGFVIDIPYTPGGRVRMVYTDVNVRPGNSGGPVVNLDGHLVGTATLMTKPKDREDAGGANYSALVPAKLTGDMIRYAFDLRKLPDASDVTPFMEMLTQEDGRLSIPEFPRRDDADVLFFEDGDRDHGAFHNETIQWESLLGKLDVPVSAVAYVMNNEEGSHLFLDGGNRIASEGVDSTFEFTPKDGTKTSKSFDEVKVVGFRTSDRQLISVEGKVVVLDSNLTHLVLMDVTGKVRFEGKNKVEFTLEQIVRIDTNDDEEQVVTLSDGRRMTGQFSDDKFKATIAATNTPIEFGLNEVATATIEIRHDRAEMVGGLGLQDVLASAGRDVKKIVKMLEVAGDASGARVQAKQIISAKKKFRKRTREQQDQFRLLYAVATMRDGGAPEAGKLFRKVRKAEDQNIAAYAQACVDLLKRYQDFSFEGEPLSKKSAFAEAGGQLAHEFVRKARDELSNAKHLEGKNRGEYFSAISLAKKHEPALTTAAVYLGIEPEDELIRVWKLAFNASVRELTRIDEEIAEKSGRGGSRGRGRGRGGAAQREIAELNEHKERVFKTAETYFWKLQDYGFRIEDPDIQKKREQHADRRGLDDDESDEP